MTANHRKKTNGNEKHRLFKVLDCMSSLLVRDYETALKRLKRYREWEEKDWRETKFYEGIADSIEGIARADKPLFLKGLNRVLEIFKRRNSQLKDIPICTDAVTLFILARERGLDISLDDLPEKLRMFIPRVLVEEG